MGKGTLNNSKRIGRSVMDLYIHYVSWYNINAILILLIFKVNCAKFRMHVLIMMVATKRLLQRGVPKNSVMMLSVTMRREVDVD